MIPAKPEKPEKEDRTFTARELSRLFGVRESKVRYWESRGLLAPSPFGFPDVVSLRTLEHLRRSGVSERRIFALWAALRALLPQVEHPFSETRLTVESRTRVVVQYRRALFDAEGQLHLPFFEEARPR